MCLTTNEPTIKIAGKNIPCYKYGEAGVYYFSPKFFPIFSYLKYVKTKRIPLLYNNKQGWGYGYEVEEGYHSFNRVIDCEGSIILGDTTGIFIIPKGADYIEGTWDGSLIPNRVSTSLIYLGKNTAFNRWIGKIFYGVSFDK